MISSSIQVCLNPEKRQGDRFTVAYWLKPLASGLTPRQALDQLAKVQMLDVVFPTTGGKKLVMSR
ncbi:MAG: hypothetical protein KJ072_16245 [Verrucomicrobia bacterium]|nr:hypothetical protein [Verrucomicrobiota bacterium]